MLVRIEPVILRWNNLRFSIFFDPAFKSHAALLHKKVIAALGEVVEQGLYFKIVVYSQIKNNVYIRLVVDGPPLLSFRHLPTYTQK